MGTALFVRLPITRSKYTRCGFVRGRVKPDSSTSTSIEDVYRFGRIEMRTLVMSFIAAAVGAGIALQAHTI